MSDVFISHTPEDSAVAHTLATALEGVGWTVWWGLQLVGGERFNRVLETELNNARCVVVLWSMRSVHSGFVKDEAAHAIRQGQMG